MNQCKRCKKFVSSNRKYCDERCRSSWRYKEISNHVNIIKLKGCKNCGYNECSAALHFHHKGEKQQLISYMVGKKHSIKKIEKEIKGCVLLCANCHAKLHYKKKGKRQ